jgi:hypothetical protein
MLNIIQFNGNELAKKNKYPFPVKKAVNALLSEIETEGIYGIVEQ